MKLAFFIVLIAQHYAFASWSPWEPIAKYGVEEPGATGDVKLQYVKPNSFTLEKSKNCDYRIVSESYSDKATSSITVYPPTEISKAGVFYNSAVLQRNNTIKNLEIIFHSKYEANTITDVTMKSEYVDRDGKVVAEGGPQPTVNLIVLQQRCN